MNVALDPWIPVLHSAGEKHRISLRDALVQGHEYTVLAADLEIQNVALLRILLALAHRVYGPADYDEWADLWESGFDPDPLDAYLEQWLDAFDSSVFMQQGEVTEKLPVSLEYLVMHHADTDGATWRPWQRMDLDTSDALIVLITAQAWLAGGKFPGVSGSLKAGGLVNKAAFYLQGDNLQKTVLLNLEQINTSSADRPSWEGSPERPGRMSDLTAQRKGIRLHSNGNDVFLQSCNEWQLTDHDLMLCYYVAGSSRKTLYGGTSATVWRNVEPLLRISEGDHPPRCLSWVSELIEVGILPAIMRLKLQSVGVDGSNRNLRAYTSGYIDLPGAVLTDRALSDAAVAAVRTAGKQAGRLSNGLKTAVPSLSGKNANARLAGHINGCYWGVLGQVYNNEFLPALPEDPDKATEAWNRTVYHQAVDAYEKITDLYNIRPKQEAEGWRRLRSRRPTSSNA